MGVIDTPSIEARQVGYCPSGYYQSGGRCYQRNNWDGYGRWILLGGLILCFFIIVPLFCCVTARRRRKRGMTPMYGSGWMARNTTTHGQYQNNPQAGYNNYGNQNYQAPPQYGQNTGTTYNSNQGYYGNDVQQPGNVYNQNRGADDYAAPPGPPPAKVQ